MTPARPDPRWRWDGGAAGDSADPRSLEAERVEDQAKASPGRRSRAVPQSAPVPPPPRDAAPATPGAGGPLERFAGWTFVLYAAALPLAMAPMNLAAGLCAVATVAVWLARPGPRWARNPTDLPALAWLAAMVIATLGSQDPSASAVRLTRGLIPLITGFAAWHVRDGRRGRAALAALLASTGVAALIGCGRFLAAGAHFPARAIGFGGSWMTFGLQTMLLVSLGVGLAITTRGRWRVAALAASLAGALGLVTSFTRSAWLGLATALAVIIGLRRPRWLLLLALAAAACVLLPGELGDRLRSAFDPAHPSNIERTMMWESGVHVFRDHPWIGAGLQNLRPLLEHYRSPLATEHPAHVHDSYLQVAISTGLVGLAAFLALCLALVRTAGGGLAASRRATGVGAGVRLGVTGGVVGFMVGALFDHAFGDLMLTFLLFTLAGLAWAARGWDDAQPPRASADAPAPASAVPASPAAVRPDRMTRPT